jgi:hypothetical protein
MLGRRIMSIRGSLDVVTTTSAMGWAYSAGSREKLTVQALLNQAVVGEAIADMHRDDLATAGLGDGNCAYHIDFYHEVDPLYLPFITVKLDGGDVDLPRSTISGYADFFYALYRQYPVTGRHRSVFGGLWTDRVDAAALLRDRGEVGMVAPQVANTLSIFLQKGFLILSDAVPRGVKPLPSSGSRRECDRADDASSGVWPLPSDVISSVLRSVPVLDLLHPILEGHPLALEAEIVEATEERFRQFSASKVLPSPAECLGLILPLRDDAVHLEVVRGSHLFPEFTLDGQSRWISQSGMVATEVAIQQSGMIDRHVLELGSVAVLGPGLIHRLRTEPGTTALRMLCTPSRQAPLECLLDGSCKEVVLESGARVWI